eukprot:3750258-Lingulodinium_polyedra.AAC.1
MQGQVYMLMVMVERQDAGGDYFGDSRWRLFWGVWLATILATIWATKWRLFLGGWRLFFGCVLCDTLDSFHPLENSCRRVAAKSRTFSDP